MQTAVCGALLLTACAQKPANTLERQLAAGDPPPQNFDPVPPPNGLPKMPKNDFSKPYGGTPPDPKLSIGQAMQKEFDRCIGSGDSVAECMQQAREVVQHLITPPRLRNGDVIIREESEPRAKQTVPENAQQPKPDQARQNATKSPASEQAAKETLPGLDLTPVGQDSDPTQKK